MKTAVKERPPRKLAGSHRGLNQQSHSTMKVWQDDRCIGVIEGNTFAKTVKGSKHMLQKPPSWAISKNAFLSQILPQTESIVVLDTESGTRWEVTTKTFADHAIEIDRGYEPQLALCLRYWNTGSGISAGQFMLWQGGECE